LARQESAVPHNVKLEGLPIGVALSSARDGEPVSVARLEFTSSEDGDEFITRLDGLPLQLLSRLPSSPDIRPSQIDHMLILIRRDETATVFVNELQLILRVRPKRALSEGDPITPDDIATIQKLELLGIEIPPADGVLFIFSVGWRKGMFFDFQPLHSPFAPRDFDLPSQFGYHYAYLAYQDFFKIGEAQWKELFAQGWFPFISLDVATRKKILLHAQLRTPIDQDISSIVQEVSRKAPQMLERWARDPLMAQRIEVLRNGVARYIDADFVSATAILYPQVEGVMRLFHLSRRTPERPTFDRLVRSVVGDTDAPLAGPYLLLPRMFRRYLEEVYLAGFVPGEDAKPSRHSFAHGVASPDKFSPAQATIAILLLDQVGYFLPGANSTPTPTSR
jgi:hypothetical protein